MASIRLSGLITGLKGKLQGSIFQMGPNGVLMRTNRNFNKVNSAPWSIQKTNMQATSSRWGTIDESQKLGWATKAEQFPTTDKYGNVRYPSGFELFCRLNRNMQSISEAPIENAPDAVPFDTIITATLSWFDGSTLNFTQDIAVPDGEILLLYAAKPKRKGRKIGVGPYRLLMTLVPEDDLTTNVYTAYNAIYPNLSDALNLAVKYVRVNQTNGQNNFAQVAYLPAA